MRKRSIAVAGHRTSISIEDPFWRALGEIAAVRAISISALVAEIDRGRASDVNLSSAIRLAVLAWYRELAGTANGLEAVQLQSEQVAGVSRISS